MKLSKWRLIVSSILILLPMVFGLLVFEYLPNEVAIHFGFDGGADGFAKPLTAVIALPLIFLVFHLACFFITVKLYRGHSLGEKVMELLYWMIPVICLIVMGSIYTVAFDLPVRISLFFYLLFALMFIFIGNYLPKCRRNQMMGVKIKWTLANDDNWNATHRFTGKLWFGCGIACLPCMLVPDAYFVYPLIGIIVITVALPFLYSYRYYRKQVREGTYTEDELVSPKLGKKGKILLTSVWVLILVAVVVVLFTGNIKYHYGDDSLTAEASYFEDLTISYADVEKVEYKEGLNLGQRQYGFGSPRLSMGVFECKEFGRYTRYTYTGCDVAVVLNVKGKTVVLNRPDKAQTKALYEEIKARVEAYHESN